MACSVRDPSQKPGWASSSAQPLSSLYQDPAQMGPRQFGGHKINYCDGVAQAQSTHHGPLWALCYKGFFHLPIPVTLPGPDPTPTALGSCSTWVQSNCGERGHLVHSERVIWKGDIWTRGPSQPTTQLGLREGVRAHAGEPVLPFTSCLDFAKRLHLSEAQYSYKSGESKSCLTRQLAIVRIF